MDKQQLAELVVEPVLKQIPYGYSESSLLAFLMCVAHESKRCEYIRQCECYGETGAFGLIQMEKLTHDQTWMWGDSIWDNALRLNIITHDQYNAKIHPPVEKLLYDLKYNVFMFRQRLFMKPEPLPEPNPIKISKYLKKHWNSAEGAASDMSYYNDYQRWD